MFKAVAITCCLMAIVCTGMAQPNIVVRGIVEDSIGSSLPKATVRLEFNHDTLVTVTNEEGRFVFNFPKADSSERPSFNLSITMKGYKLYQKRIHSSASGRQIQLGTIHLEPDYRDLDPVTIIRVRPITIKEDTVDYHAAAFPVRDGSGLETLLKRLPGIEVDPDGSIIVQGKKISKVMVDGKLFFGGDVLTATRNLPADIIDKIEIIDDYGDKARLTGVKSGESDKVLNIVLKQDRRNGLFGHVQVGDGNKDRYIGQIFANAFRGERQMAFNGSLENNSSAGDNFTRNINTSFANRLNKELVFDANGQVSGNTSNSSGSSVQDNYYTGGQLHQQQSSQSRSDNQHTSFSGNLNYRPSTHTTLRISPSFNTQSGQQNQLSTFSTLERDSNFTKSTTGSSVTETNTKAISAGTNIYYEQLFPASKSRFSAEANIQYAHNAQTGNNLVNTFMKTDSLNSQSTLHYLVTNPNSSLNMNANLNYFSPLGSSGFLDLGYNVQTSSNINNKVTKQPDSVSGVNTIIDSLSNRYNLQTTIHRLHTGYIVHYHKLDMTLRLEGQAGALDGTSSLKGGTGQYHYFNWLPLAQLNWSLSRSQKLSFQYNSNSSPPSLQQLQPIVDLTNPQYPIIGNPALRPSFTQNFSLHFEQASLQPTRFHGFGINLSYNTTEHAIVTNIVHPRDTGSVIQRTSFLNVNGFHSLQTGYHLSLPPMLHNYLRITLRGNLGSMHSVSMTDSILYSTTTFNIGQSLHLQCIVPDILESDLSGSYNFTQNRLSTPGSSPFSSPSATWSLNNKHYFGSQWILSYNLMQSFTQGTENRLQSAPAYLTATVQRQFLRKNRATITLTAYDLLNSATGVSQLVTPTSISQSQTQLVGRYFLLSFLFKWEKFGR